MEREDLPGECLMEYDFRFMTLAEDVGCMILSGSKSSVRRLIAKRCKDFEIPLLMLYPPAQFFAETAITIKEDKERTEILNNCQIRHIVIPKRVIFPAG
jgi:hypothetical protein